MRRPSRTRPTSATIAAALLCCSPLTQAALVDVTVSGNLDGVQANTNSSSFFGVERTFIDSFDHLSNKAFSFTFRYDTEATPASQSGNAANGLATWTTGVSLLSGQIGSFSDFSGFDLSMILSTSSNLSPSLGGDRIQFVLDDPTSSRLVNLDLRFSTLPSGRDIFPDPFHLPDASALSGPVRFMYAGGEVRRTGPLYLGYNKGINNGTESITAVPALLPEPAAITGLALASLTALACRRR